MTVKELIKKQRHQLQLDRECLKKAKLLTDREKERINKELEELRILELSLFGGYLA